MIRINWGMTLGQLAVQRARMWQPAYGSNWKTWAAGRSAWVQPEIPNFCGIADVCQSKTGYLGHNELDFFSVSNTTASGIYIVDERQNARWTRPRRYRTKTVTPLKGLGATIQAAS